MRKLIAMRLSFYKASFCLSMLTYGITALELNANDGLTAALQMDSLLDMANLAQLEQPEYQHLSQTTLEADGESHHTGVVAV